MSDRSQGPAGNRRGAFEQVARIVLAAALCGMLPAGCGTMQGGKWLATAPAPGTPIAVADLPPQMLAEGRDARRPIAASMLRQRAPDPYRVGPGDLLGVYVAGVVTATPASDAPAGNATTSGPAAKVEPAQPAGPMLTFSTAAALTSSPPPSAAPEPPVPTQPVAVAADGTIALPQVWPIPVAGRTLAEIEAAVSQAYPPKPPERPAAARVTVKLLQPRYARVLVIRQSPRPIAALATIADLTDKDTPAKPEAPKKPASLKDLVAKNSSDAKKPAAPADPPGRQITALVLDLPAYENDVLGAVTRSCGPHGLDDVESVVIQRGYFNPYQDPQWVVSAAQAAAPQGLPTTPVGVAGWSLRIPTRIASDEKASFRAEDVVLGSGDAVFIQARDPEVFYTAGLLPAGVHRLPRDYDMDVLQAVQAVHGPMLQGKPTYAVNADTPQSPGVGFPAPSVALVERQTAQGKVTIRVDLTRAQRDPRENLILRPGDVVRVQEASSDSTIRSLAKYFSPEPLWRAVRGPQAERDDPSALR